MFNKLRSNELGQQVVLLAQLVHLLAWTHK
jgi:hypothetical protein